MVRPERTEPIRVCLDSDVVIAGLFSTSGASHALLVLGELGLLAVVVPEAAVEEVTRNLQAKLPEALPLFDRFLDSPAVEVQAVSTRHLESAQDYAHAKDVPILAAALAARAAILVTHNTRHFRKIAGVRVTRPGTFVREVRAWMLGFSAEA